MKNLRQLFATFVLVLVLASAAWAEEGIIYPWVIPPPPPSTSGAVHPGEEINGADASIDLVTEMTLTIVQNLLTLF
jgi:hypothetical protein